MSVKQRAKPLVTRSVLRDIVLLVCSFSAVFFDLGRFDIVAGLVLLVAGCGLHILSKGILVRNVVLSERGIYGFVRHPYYLSNYVIDSSFCLLSGNPYLLLLYPFLFFWAYGPTIRKEEALLASYHEAAFARHSAEVPQIFPDRASLKRVRAIFDDFSWGRITWKEVGRILRFMSLAAFILLIHQVRADGVKGVWTIVRPTRLDYDEFVIALLTVIFYCGSRIFLSRAKKERRPIETS
jgi:protein-S-isoprenylcysteine O-methyltransferase Ste14